MPDSIRPLGESSALLLARESLSGYPDPDVGMRYPYRQRPARHFIVTHGRSGSSLLSAILEDCGADFGEAAAHGEDTFSSHRESRTLDRAIRCAQNASRLFRPGIGGVRRMAYRFWRSRAKRLLRAGLKDTPYSKNRWNTTILPLVERLGWRPVLIVSYRSPAELAMSDMLQLKSAASIFLPLILQTFVDSLYSIQRYGGVVIDHADLVNRNEADWAIGLGAVTGFAPTALIDARNRLLKPARSRQRPAVWVPPELDGVASTLGALCNRPLAPSVW